MSNDSIATILAVALCATFFSGCSFKGAGGSLRSTGLRSIDGLDRATVELPGTLELRENHGIGGYDRLLIPPATLTYKRESLRLTHPARRVFLELLRESLIEASQAAGIRIETEPGHCVMEIDIGALGMDLALGREADQLAQLAIVMQFRDSLSGEPLLRYSTQRRIENPARGIDPDSKLKDGLDRIIADLNIATSMRSANLADDEVRPGCSGTFAALGRAARQQQAR